jgi:redox-sensitive bicupin YhaK (pirin superfamily)
MMAPRYQELPAAGIPSAVSPDGKARARVLAGEAWGVKAAIETRTPIHYLDFTVEPGGRVLHPVPLDFNAFAYVFGGAGVFGADSKQAQDGQMVAFASDGEAVSFEATGPGTLEVLLVGGRPLREPVARYGPFVMNTEREIYQAIEDYNSGHFGEIKH